MSGYCLQPLSHSDSQSVAILVSLDNKCTSWCLKILKKLYWKIRFVTVKKTHQYPKIYKEVASLGLSLMASWKKHRFHFRIWINMIGWQYNIDPNVLSPLDVAWWCMNFQFSPWFPPNRRHHWDKQHTTVWGEEGCWELNQMGPQCPF